jgi:hypothetical protein
MPPSPRRHGWHLFRLRVGDELSVAHRVVVNSELEQSVEQEPSARRAAAIEAEDELVEEIREMRVVEATLMSAREPPLRERGDPVHSREHDVGGLPTALEVDRLVDVAVSDGWRIAGPGVGDERRSLRCSRLRNARARTQTRRRAPPCGTDRILGALGARRPRRPGPSSLLSAAAQSGLLAAEVRLIDFDGAGEAVAPGTDEHRAEPVQHRPGRLIGAELKGPLQALRRDPVLRRRELPAHREPHRERRSAPVEQSASRHSGPLRAACALVSPVCDAPTSSVLTPGTDETLGPA